MRNKDAQKAWLRGGAGPMKNRRDKRVADPILEAADASGICVACGRELEEKGCKRRCPCGYFEDCSHGEAP